MATEKPSDNMEWATAEGATDEPPGGKRVVGFEPDERPPAKWFNWLFLTIHRWLTWVDERMHDSPGDPRSPVLHGEDASGTDDTDGGNLVLRGGAATGEGSSKVAIQAATAGGAGGDVREPEDYLVADGSEGEVMATKHLHALSGVRGETSTPSGAGVEGLGETGVRGEASTPSGAGVEGLGGETGVRGEGTVVGVSGLGSRGVEGIGSQIGVRGEGTGTNSTGVRGIGKGVSPGVVGESGGAGPGVLGESGGAGPGVVGMAGTEGFGVAAHGSVSRAALQLYQQNEPSLPSRGSVWVDSKTGKLSFYDGDGAEYVARKRFCEVLNSPIGTSLGPISGAEYTIPPGTLRSRSEITVRASGSISSDETPLNSLEILVYLGSQYLGGPAFLPGSSLPTGRWCFEGHIIITDDSMAYMMSTLIIGTSITSGSGPTYAGINTENSNNLALHGKRDGGLSGLLSWMYVEIS